MMRNMRFSRYCHIDLSEIIENFTPNYNLE